MEDTIYGSYAIRKFMGINFFEQDVPDATTLLHFRHLLEEHGVGKLLCDAINRCLERAGRMMRGGTIVDATLISAPSSTKNAEKKRDPEVHQTKKETSGILVWNATPAWMQAAVLSLRWKPPPAGPGCPGFQTTPLTLGAVH